MSARNDNAALLARAHAEAGPRRFTATLDPDLYRGLIFPRTLRDAFPCERQTINYATGRLPVIDPMPNEPIPRWMVALWMACFVGAIVVSWLLRVWH